MSERDSMRVLASGFSDFTTKAAATARLERIVEAWKSWAITEIADTFTLHAEDVTGPLDATRYAQDVAALVDRLYDAVLQAWRED